MEIREIDGEIYVKLPLKPSDLNEALKEFKDDADRLIAMEGICKCGAVTNGSTCWSCYDSGGNY